MLLVLLLTISTCKVFKKSTAILFSFFNLSAVDWQHREHSLHPYSTINQIISTNSITDGHFCEHFPRISILKCLKIVQTGTHCSLPELSVGGRCLRDDRCWRRQSWVKCIIAQVKGERTWSYNGWSGCRAYHRLCENLLLTNQTVIIKRILL